MDGFAVCVTADNRQVVSLFSIVLGTVLTEPRSVTSSAKRQENVLLREEAIRVEAPEPGWHVTLCSGVMLENV